MRSHANDTSILPKHQLAGASRNCAVVFCACCRSSVHSFVFLCVCMIPSIPLSVARAKASLSIAFARLSLSRVANGRGVVALLLPSSLLEPGDRLWRLRENPLGHCDATVEHEDLSRDQPISAQQSELATAASHLRRCLMCATFADPIVSRKDSSCIHALVEQGK